MSTRKRKLTTFISRVQESSVYLGAAERKALGKAFSDPERRDSIQGRREGWTAQHQEHKLTATTM